MTILLLSVNSKSEARLTSTPVHHPYVVYTVLFSLHFLGPSFEEGFSYLGGNGKLAFVV